MINPGISYSRGFAEIDACVAAKLDVWVWETGGYPRHFMDRILAWYQSKIMVANHIEDAKQRARERQERRRSRRRGGSRRV